MDNSAAETAGQVIVPRVAGSLKGRESLDPSALRESAKFSELAQLITNLKAGALTD